MEELLGFLFELLFELVLEVLIQLASWLSSSKIERPQRSPITNFFIYTLFGFLAAGASLLVFPHHIIKADSGRLIMLLVNPLVCGLLMSEIGRRQKEMGRNPTAIANFKMGFWFALVIAVTRFFLAKDLAPALGFTG